jgi:hypothetical protein
MKTLISILPLAVMLIAGQAVSAVPDTTTLVQPANNSINLNTPVKLKWHKAKNATKYWLCATTDNWQTLTINDSSLTDTSFTILTLPTRANVRWNVATGNNEGWNKTGWATDWKFSLVTISGSGTVKTQVVYYENFTTHLVVSTAKVQVYDAATGLYLNTMTYTPSGSGNYWLFDVPDVTRNYELVCMLPESVMTHGLWWDGSLPKTETVPGNSYVIHSSDFNQDKLAYPRQFWYVGVYPLPTSVADEIIPEKFTVLQNYPNPFNPTTTIEYTVKKSGMVQLKVVDILGRETVLVDEVQPTGTYRHVWASQSSGTYFAVLQTPEQRKVISMSAIK